MYDIKALGGHMEKVREIVRARPAGWDTEVIEELLKWGAAPPLHSCGIIHDGRYKSIECIFVEPSGKLTEGIFVPYGVMKYKYGDRVK